ncbi:MAG: hypothetical protein HYV65_03060 [Candidatus Spechtbacteria bacterium]|nr:hypothetical protein [Candidatus Spechtbacteria bacterium]
MDDRQTTILRYVIEDYINSAIPIGSQFLAEKYGLGISPATIRKEMMDLTEAGYLEQPHTSAGRIPTAKGYHFFVDVVMEDIRARNEASDENKIAKKLQQLIDEAEREVMPEITEYIADMTRNFVLGWSSDRAFYSDGVKYLLNEPEFNDHQTLCEMVLFMEDAQDEIPQRLAPTEKVRVFIGNENPISKAQDFSMLACSVSLPDNAEGTIAIVGPMRMQYRKNIAVLDYLQQYTKELFI